MAQNERIAFYREISARKEAAGDFQAAIANLVKAKELDPSNSAFYVSKIESLKRALHPENEELKNELERLYKEAAVNTENIVLYENAEQAACTLMTGLLSGSEDAKARLAQLVYGQNNVNTALLAPWLETVRMPNNTYQAAPAETQNTVLKEYMCNMNTEPKPSIKGWSQCVLDFYKDRLDIRVLATHKEMMTAGAVGGAVGMVIGGSRTYKTVKKGLHLQTPPDYILRYSDIRNITLMNKTLTRIAFIEMKDGRTYNAQIGKVVVQYLQECGSSMIPPERFIIK